MGMISVPFQYDIVQILKKNGINSSMFRFRISNIKKYKQLIDSEDNKSIKKNMKINYFGVIIPLIIALLCFLTVCLIIFIYTHHNA
jgi:hypothetical protein